MPIEPGSQGELRIKLRLGHRPLQERPYLEPETVFSDEQWAAIAQLIGRSEIPLKAKKDICKALFEYTLATIKPEELDRFVEEVRQFRARSIPYSELSKKFSWIEKIEELIEEIFQVQQFLDREFKRRPNPKGRASKVSRARYFGLSSGPRIYGPHWQSAGSNYQPGNGQIDRALFPTSRRRFLSSTASSPAGLKDAIGKARQALMPKNQKNR